MLGWEIVITNKATAELYAKWIVGLNGDNWLRQLGKDGIAEVIREFGGNQYIAKAKDIVPLITPNLPNYKAGLVVGEDYVREGGLNTNVEMNTEALLSCAPDELLHIQTWDLG